MNRLEIAKSEYTDSALTVPEPGYSVADFTISDNTRARIADGIPANTRRAYERQWADFLAWCAERGRVALPATAQTLADYVSHLADDLYAPASIEQAVGAIRTRHRTAGYKQQPDTDGALVVLRGYRRHLADNGQRGQREAPPVTIDALRAMINVCDLDTRTGIRNRLVLVAGLAVMGRRSELVGLHRHDVREAADGLEISIRTSKTDKNSRGEIIAVPRGSHPLTNPVAAWRDWLEVLDDADETGGRLLRRVYRHGSLGPSLSGDAVNTIVRTLALKADVPRAEEFTAHSLRAGGATVAYAAGVPVSIIAKHGRWSPTSPVLLRYIRAVDRWRDNAMRNVGL